MRKSLAEIFAYVGERAADRGDLRCLTLSQLTGTPNDVETCVVTAEVKVGNSIVTIIVAYLNDHYEWSQEKIGNCHYEPSNFVDGFTYVNT